MRRRAYLSLVAVVLAGCGSQGTDTETPTAAGTDDAETATDEPTATPTTAPDPGTATPEQAPADPLPAFEFWLTNAFDAFVGSAESFGAVTAATEVDAATTREHLAEADAVRQELEDADLEGDRRTRFEELSGTYHFLRRTVQILEHLRTAWNVRADAWDAVVTREGDGPGGLFGELDEVVDDAEADYNSLIAESDPTDVASFPPLLVSDYEDKVGQFEAEMTAFRDQTDALRDLHSAMNEAERGMLHYGNGSYTPASVSFTDATNAFESVTNAVGGNWPDHFTDPVDDVDCVAGAMAAGCDRMAQVSRAVGDGDENDPEAAKQSARSRFEQCDIVFERVSTVQDFFE